MGSSSTAAGAGQRVLLDTCRPTVPDQNMQAVLHKTSALISRIVPFGIIALLLVDERRGMARLHALETGSQTPAIDPGVELSIQDTAAGLAIDEQRPVLVEDGEAELWRFPEIAARLHEPVRSF